MKKEIMEKLLLLTKAFKETLYSNDEFFMENMKTCSLANDDIQKYRYWEWPQGVGLYGLWKMYEFTRDKSYLDELCNYYDKRLAEGLPSKNINTIAPMLTLAFVYEETKNKKYILACKEWAKWIMSELPRTEERGFQHITSDTVNNGELWADTLFMAVLFLAKMGQMLKNDAYIEEAKYQLLLHIKYLADAKSGLWYHGWTFNGTHNFAKAFWGRGNCWATLAIPEILSIIPVEDFFAEHSVNVLINQIHALKNCQTSSGMWRTLIDDESSYEEASATSGFASGILKAVNIGLIEDRYADIALKALKPILALVDEKGFLQQVSYGTPMGRENKEFYKKIPLQCMPYGQALGMLFLIETLKYMK